MITAQDAALQRARAYVRDRGWRHEPLSWEEVRALVEAVDAEIECASCDSPVSEYCDSCGADVTWNEGYDPAKQESLTVEEVEDWAAETGHRLIKENAA